MRRFLLTTLIIAAAGAAVWTQTIVQRPPSRDTRVAPVGPAEISGVIMTDEETPQPVRRAQVRAVSDDGVPRTTHTDAAGRFVFANLPTGRYTIEATKPGFVRAAFGAKRHDRPGTPVTVTDDQRTQTLQIRMPRGGVITGRITDEFGQPAQGTRVRAQLVRTINGERTLVSVPTPGALFGEGADDRGVYRLYGLPAGEYVVSATPSNSDWGNIQRMSEAELRAADQAVQRPNGAAGRPPEPVSPPAMLGYTPVFYPGVFEASQARSLPLRAGEERAGIDVVVQFVRTATIEGTVVTAGMVRPESVQLLMMPRRSGQGGAMITMSLANRRVDQNGRFSYTGVTPGSYTISARASQEGGSPLWASTDVEVDGRPLSGVTLVMQEGLDVSGQMVFEADGVDPPGLFSRARLNLMPADGNAVITLGGSTTEVNDSGGFTIRGVTPGRYRVTASFNTPEANWNLKSAVVKGTDAIDVPFELAPGDTITNAVFTFTNRTQELSGTLQDAAMRPAPDYTVVVFPADKALWGSSRRVRTTRPDTDGRFAFDDLPAGAYRIGAVVDIGREELGDPALLEELLAASVPFTLADGEKKVQDLWIASGGGGGDSRERRGKQ